MKKTNFININSEIYQQRNFLTEKDVADDHKWIFIQRGMDFNKNLNLKGLYCYHPFNTITIDKFGDVYVCTCQAWLPISVGKIWEFESLNDCVRSPRAREIQASIIDGTFKYCDNKTCGLIKNRDGLKKEINHKPDGVNWINFAIDPSCNLSCPSCRKEFIFYKEGEEYDKKIKITNHLIKLINNHDEWLKFSLSNDGDPFASLVYRHFLNNLNLRDRPLTEIELVTNGILLESHWDKVKHLNRNIIRIKISFDAGNEHDYNLTRKGDWNKLLNSSKFIANWKKNNNPVMKLTSNFVVQKLNFRSMIDYIKLCDNLGFNEINFQKINDWGTMPNFDDHAIWKDSHPDHQEFLDILSNDIFNHPKVNLTNIANFKK